MYRISKKTCRQNGGREEEGGSGGVEGQQQHCGAASFPEKKHGDFNWKGTMNGLPDNI